MNGVSIIICGYNSAQTITETLKHAQNQDNLSNDNWEVLLINNNSTDNTEEIARNTWDDSKGSQLRIIKEEKVGLSNARIRGVKESKFDIISYVDDDNLIPSNWVSYILTVFKNKEVGVLGCTAIGKFDIEEPEWYQKEQHKLAFATGRIYKGDDFMDVTEDGLLFGAGLTMRKEIFEKLWAKNWQPLLSDRKGESQSSGGDSELTLASRLLGYKIYFTNEISIIHWIINDRLSWERLRKVTKGFGEADVSLLPYNYYYKQIKGNLTAVDRLRKSWAFNYFGKFISLQKCHLRRLMGQLDREDHEILSIRLGSFLDKIWKKRAQFRQNYKIVENLLK